jgi:hypothetical protein
MAMLGIFSFFKAGIFSDILGFQDVYVGEKGATANEKNLAAGLLGRPGRFCHLGGSSL